MLASTITVQMASVQWEEGDSSRAVRQGGFQARAPGAYSSPGGWGIQRGIRRRPPDTTTRCSAAVGLAYERTRERLVPRGVGVDVVAVRGLGRVDGARVHEVAVHLRVLRADLVELGVPIVHSLCRIGEKAGREGRVDERSDSFVCGQGQRCFNLGPG